MVGTSIAAGFRVSQEQTIAALLPAELSRRTGRKVEIYNEGLPLRPSSSISRNFNEVLAADPDMILWIVSPLDISNPSLVGAQGTSSSLCRRLGRGPSQRRCLPKNPSNASIATIFSHTRAAILLKDLIYESPSLYVQSSLMGADYKKDFLTK